MKMKQLHRKNWFSNSKDIRIQFEIMEPNFLYIFYCEMWYDIFKLLCKNIIPFCIYTGGIEKLDLGDEDTKGDLYEYLLSKVATAGTNGQFRTPRHIIKMMVQLVKPQVNNSIIDPAMGSAGFLIEAQQFIRENYESDLMKADVREHFHNTMFYGNDMERTMLRIGAMNIMLHGVDNPNISYRDSLSEQNTDEEKYTLVLANPPISMVA